MNRFVVVSFPLVCALVWSCAAPLREGPTATGAEAPPGSVKQVLDRAVKRTVQQYASRGFKPENLAATLVDLTPGPRLHERAGFRETEAIYPASVVKLFYAVAVCRWLEDGRLQRDAELERAVHDMLVDSSNDATAYVLDRLTGTVSGPELPAAEMAAWAEQRAAVQRYFAQLGYSGINVVQKTWGDGPYGRERVFYGPDFENRNRLTTAATARLLQELVEGQAVSAARSAQVRALLARDPSKGSTDPDDENTGFTGRALPRGARLWSKAGWMSRVRHDAAYVELPSGRKFVLVVFTTGEAFANERDLLGTFVREAVSGMEKLS